MTSITRPLPLVCVCTQPTVPTMPKPTMSISVTSWFVQSLLHQHLLLNSAGFNTNNLEILDSILRQTLMSILQEEQGNDLHRREIHTFKVHTIFICNVLLCQHRNSAFYLRVWVLRPHVLVNLQASGKISQILLITY